MIVGVFFTCDQSHDPFRSLIHKAGAEALQSYYGPLPLASLRDRIITSPAEQPALEELLGHVSLPIADN